MTKQTAVEWLINELGEYFPHGIGGIHLMIEQAKAMEKEQIMNAWVIGLFSEGKTTSEEYYNQTFKK